MMVYVFLKFLVEIVYFTEYYSSACFLESIQPVERENIILPPFLQQKSSSVNAKPHSVPNNPIMKPNNPQNHQMVFDSKSCRLPVKLLPLVPVSMRTKNSWSRCFVEELT